jgi:hypothetical protein
MCCSLRRLDKLFDGTAPPFYDSTGEFLLQKIYILKRGLENFSKPFFVCIKPALPGNSLLHLLYY